MDYRTSGVDIDAANDVVRRVRQLARRTFTPGVLSDIGSFGGLFRLDTARYREPVLVASADGVGTKLRVAFMTGRERETDTLEGGLYLLPLADPTPRPVELVCPEDFGQPCQPFSIEWSPDLGAFTIEFYYAGEATLTAGGLLTFDDDT